MLGIAWAGASALAAEPRPPDVVDDVVLLRAVENELASERIGLLGQIEVRCLDGVVTVVGQVDNLLERDHLLHVLRSTRGVRGIVDRTRIVPLPRSDTELEARVAAALASDPAVEEGALAVSASEGEVLLEGSVGSWQERHFAHQAARGVPGVRHVRNELAVDHSRPRPDGEILEDIRRRLTSDMRVHPGLIEVAVDRGSVRLAGVVGSAAEREHAYDLAWVTGVKAVDAAALEMRWWARDPMRRIAPRTQDDPAIERALRDALALDPRVRGQDIAVEVRDGVVALVGSVGSSTARAAAADDARNVFGVRRVDNWLEVFPRPASDDAALEGVVARLLAADPFLRRHDVYVSADDGHVVLRGMVDSAFDRARAEALAGGAHGTKSVETRFELRDDPTPDTDPEIAGRVRDGLFWDARIDESRIRVHADTGVVTLSGWVDDPRQRDLAAEQALQSGADGVRNQLEVRSQRAPSPGPAPDRGVGGNPS